MSTSIPASTLDKFATFGDLLRFLRRRAGLTQLELSIAVGYSDAQISRLEQNLRLPDIPTIEARFVPVLDLQGEPEVVARLLELAANVRREDAPGLGICPYKGLNYFEETDADLFAGREALTAKLVKRVHSLASSRAAKQSRFLTIIGASGSGKSSLVRAGLVPALRWNPLSASWLIHILTPTAHPLESLAMSLTQETGSVAATAALVDDLAREPRSLKLFLKRSPESAGAAHVLLVIDQFEELFTQCRTEVERAAFIGNLLTAAADAGGRVIVLITLRADFYAHCADHPLLRESLAQQQEYIGAMSPEEMRRAIEEPAYRGRWEFEPGLVDLLLHDVGHEPGALPLLSHALLETWQRRRGRVLTLSGYAASGGVRGAIAETAEAVFADQFSPEEQVIARRIFLRLTELGDDTATGDTRRRATFNELILKPEEKTLTHNVLKVLADARLIITSEDSAEVAHEALIREWPTLRGWLEDNREGLRLHRQLTEAAQEWLARSQEQDVLYRGARLARANEWASSHQDDMNALEFEFLQASQAMAEREANEREAQRQRELEAAQKLARAEQMHAEAERRRAEEQTRAAGQMRKRSVYLAGAFLVAIVLALAAGILGVQAHNTSRLAASRELAAASISSLEVDPERSILLALEALSAGHTIEAEDALHQSVQASRVQRVLQAHEPGAPVSVVFHPDGKRIVTASLDNRAQVWDAAMGELVLRVDGNFAALSPDGTRLATTGVDGGVKIWDAENGQELPLASRIDANYEAAFSPDGARLATITLGNLPRVWDARTGEELLSFPGHTDYVSAAYFSHDGARLLTVSDDRTARVWDTTTGDELLVLSGHPGWVLAAAFSPDDRQIVTATEDEAILWDAATGEKLRSLAGHTNTVFSVAFSPDGSRVATGSLDRKVKVWEAATGEELLTLPGHTGAVYSLAFSPDGTRLATASDDGTVRLWDLLPTRELLNLSTPGGSGGQIAYRTGGLHLAAVGQDAIQVWDLTSGEEISSLPNADHRANDLLFSPDGVRLFIAGQDQTLRVWEISRGRESLFPTGHTGAVTALAFTPDGARLATASEDYRVKIWDVQALLEAGPAANPLLLTLDHPGKVFSAAFSPDGSRLAAGGQDGTVRLWGATSGEEVQVLRGHTEVVMSVAFSPNGKRLATSALDGTAKLWETASGTELAALSGHTNAISAITFSPDGARLATASWDGTAKLWDAASGQELLTFSGDGSGLSEVAFSPDGRHLAVGGENETRVYLLNTEDLAALARTRVTRSLTSEECQKYLHKQTSACTLLKSIPTSTPLPPAAHGRVCLVTNTGGLFDEFFNEMIYNGTQEASRVFAWEANVLQSTTRADFEKNIKEFVRGECDLIAGTLPMLGEFQISAEANPDQKYLMVDFLSDQPQPNVWAQTYAIDQAAFLAGYAAASVTKTGKVGIFGGIDIPPVTGFMDGFTLGVDYYNQQNGTQVEVLGWDVAQHAGLFTGDFCCTTEGRRMAETLLGQGADIILPVAGTSIGAGALAAVHEHGNAYLIGVDNDWALNSPRYSEVILTSIEKRLDVTVVEAVRSIVEGSFTGGVHLGTLESGEVGIAPFYELEALVPARVEADLEQIKAGIIAGEIKTRP